MRDRSNDKRPPGARRGPAGRKDDMGTGRSGRPDRKGDRPGGRAGRNADQRGEGSRRSPGRDDENDDRGIRTSRPYPRTGEGRGGPDRNERRPTGPKQRTAGEGRRSASSNNEKPRRGQGKSGPRERSGTPESRPGQGERRLKRDVGTRPGTGSGFRTRDGSTKRTTGRGPDVRSRRGTKAAEQTNDGLIRLNRYLAQSGVASRREADELIKAGVVSVNGKVVTELGTKVSPGDRVHYGGQRLTTEKKRYVLVNKPKDFITTTDDPRDRRTVMALIDDACRERLYPVGRLDRNTTGVLLMTNDGDLAKRLTHPSHGAEKIYHVTLDKSVVKADLERLVEGIQLDDGPATADEASYVDGASRKEVGIKLHMGRNRIVRRMFEALGYNVVKLDRVVFAGLTKKDLPRGKWRHLTEKEVLFLSKRK